MEKRQRFVRRCECAGQLSGNTFVISTMFYDMHNRSKKPKKLLNSIEDEAGEPKMDPECLEDQATIEKNALNRPKWPPDGSQDPFTRNDS